MIPISELRRALDSIEAPADWQERLGLVLNWLAGAGRSEHSRRLEARLGSSDQRPDMLLAVHDWLDDELFIGSALSLEAAGLGQERSQQERRRRYRQLLGAFHPDRHPELSERLTDRLQAINQAYARFKRNPVANDSAGATAVPAAPAASTSASKTERYEGIAPHHKAQGLSGWRQRWGQDRFLGHKLVLLMALLLMFPLISIYLDDHPAQTWPGELPQLLTDSETERQPARRLPAGLDLRALQWPPQDSAQPWLESATVETGEVVQAADQAAFVEIELPPAPPWVGSLRQPRTWLSGLGELINRLDWQARPPQNLALVEAPPKASPQVAPRAVAERAPAPRPAPSEPPAAVISEGAKPDIVQPDAVPFKAPPQAVAEVVIDDLPKPEPEPQSAAITAALEPFPVPVPERSGGELQLGILASHDAGLVLTALQRSIESGDIDGLLQLLSRSPSETRGRGRRWFRQHYGELFDRTAHRALSLEVLTARRDGNAWQVEARFEFVKIVGDNAEERRNDGLVLYTLQPERGQMRIAAMEFQ